MGREPNLSEISPRKRRKPTKQNKTKKEKGKHKRRRREDLLASLPLHCPPLSFFVWFVVLCCVVLCFALLRGRAVCGAGGGVVKVLFAGSRSPNSIQSMLHSPNHHHHLHHLHHFFFITRTVVVAFPPFPFVPSTRRKADRT